MPAQTERRRFERFEIKLPANLNLPGREPLPCEIRDYCEGGLLVAMGTPEVTTKALDIEQKVEVSTHLHTKNGSRRGKLKTRVAWLNAPYIGLKFAQPSGVILKALQLHNRLSQMVSATSSFNERTQNEVKCLAKLRHVAQGSIPALLRELLSKTIEQLLEASDHVRSNEDRYQIYSDLNALEDLRKKDLLMRELLSRALHPLSGETGQKPSPPHELALIETDDFERWLEASRAANQLERCFSEQLDVIGSRLASRRPSDGPTALSVPFEPKNFTDALKEVAKQIQLGSVAREMLFDSGVKVMNSQLGTFYARLGSALDSLGVPQAPQPQPLRITHPERRTAATGDPEVPPRHQRETQDKVDARVSVSVPAEVAQRPSNPLDSTDLGTQTELVAIDKRSLERLLLRDREQREKQARELIANLETELDKPESVAGWLQQVGRSVVDQAIEEPTFFDDNRHPLHSLLDTLGHLQQFRPTPDAPPDQDPLRREIDKLLEPVANGQADRDLLQDISKKLSTLTQQQSQSYRRNVERVVEASEGRDRVRLARKAVSQELRRRYDGHQVPAVVPELLDFGWRALLELSWLNTATRQEDFTRQLGLLDALVNKLGGQPFDTDQEQITNRELLEQISNEIETVAFDPFQLNNIDSRLKKALFDSDAEPIPLIGMPHSPTEGFASDECERPAEIAQPTWQFLLECIDSIRLGDRIRFFGITSGEQLLRVAWIREDRGSFALVDHRGIKSREIARADLALDLHRRHIQLESVDGRPLSERAVGNMLESMRAQLNHQVGHDSLTGLINRVQFNTALDQALGDSEATNGVLVWLDIDQFKLINELHGYEAGDRVLVSLAKLIEQTQGHKIAGHLGADRFAVLLSTSEINQGIAWTERLCQAANEMAFEWQNKAHTIVSLSAGVVATSGVEADSGSLSHAAENALAAAKNAGGNRVLAYCADDPEIAQERDTVQWVARVDEALVEGELKLRCQPILPVRSGDGIHPHYEVLLGVVDADNNSLSIAEFIQAAERYKRMRSVDRWVTKTVFDSINRYRDLMPELHGFAINLSGQTASDPEFVDFVRQQFTRTQIKPDGVSFEVTETAAVASLSGTANIIRDLKRIGCKVALDDFGSGLASYSYLKEMPVDWLKIDGVFVRDIATDREDFAVVKSINDIGHFLGKQTIAEYVKDQPTLDLVRDIGVDFAQGFGIAKPILLESLFQSHTVKVAS